jgi:hypothetical protein
MLQGCHTTTEHRCGSGSLHGLSWAGASPGGALHTLLGRGKSGVVPAHFLGQGDRAVLSLSGALPLHGTGARPVFPVAPCQTHFVVEGAAATEAVAVGLCVCITTASGVVVVEVWTPSAEHARKAGWRNAATTGRAPCAGELVCRAWGVWNVPMGHMKHHQATRVM